MHATVLAVADGPLRHLPGFRDLTIGITIETGLRYGFFAGLAWLLGYVLFKRRWRRRKIIPRQPASAEIWREIRYSALTLVVFGLVGGATVQAARHGWTQMYWRLPEHGWPWFFASIVGAIFLHDAYFYWTHRLMHRPRFFPWFHRAHHLSTNPSPWAAYAFPRSKQSCRPAFSRSPSPSCPCTRWPFSFL